MVKFHGPFQLKKKDRQDTYLTAFTRSRDAAGLRGALRQRDADVGLVLVLIDTVNILLDSCRCKREHRDLPQGEHAGTKRPGIVSKNAKHSHSNAGIVAAIQIRRIGLSIGSTARLYGFASSVTGMLTATGRWPAQYSAVVRVSTTKKSVISSASVGSSTPSNRPIAMTFQLVLGQAGTLNSSSAYLATIPK